MKREIFVFGSNEAGRHGKGSALYAREKWGAVYGQGLGLQGNSYAIPTKNRKLGILPLKTICNHVRDFVSFACLHPEMEFKVVAIGCGLAGYKPSQIAPMFYDVPANVILPSAFEEVLGNYYGGF